MVQRLALHQNGVEFRQQFNGAIITSLTALYDDVRRHLIICYTMKLGHRDTHRHVQNLLHSEVALAINMLLLLQAILHKKQVFCMWVSL